MAFDGRPAGVDPEAFKIIDGKLYLTFDKDVADNFAAKADEAIKSAEINWVKQKN